MPFEIKADDLKDDGTFSGYASTFGGEPDSVNDIIKRGAFLETLASNGVKGRGIKLLWQHDSRNPIGKWLKIEENNKGLGVEGKLTRGVKQADEAYLLLKDGAIDGLSIGFGLDKDGYEIDEKRNIRTLKKVNLYEISLVTFGANAKARITNVKALLKDVKTIREVEHILRDAGFSAVESKHLISIVKNDNKQGLQESVLDALKKVNADLTIQKIFR